jgi:hypothetical protein
MPAILTAVPARRLGGDRALDLLVDHGVLDGDQQILSLGQL